MAATEATPRVALLARAGDACDRISQALSEAGAEVVLVADPLQAAPEEVRQAMPEAILVALDPAIEDAIDRYADVLADPDYMVIFEEAEQAAQRTGWDAARWLRHLSAKLHRHNDVLPAGAEPDEVLLPTPGPLPPTTGRVDYDEAIAAVTGEAQQRADGVPRDSVVDGPVASAPALEVQVPAWSLDEPVADAGVAGNLPEQSFAEDSALAGSDDLAVPDMELVVPPLPEDASPGAGEDELSFDPERFNRAGQAQESVAGIEEFLAAQLGQEATTPDAAPAAAPAATGAGRPSGAEAPQAPTFDLSGLSLADNDAIVAAPAPAAPAPAFDLDRLGDGLSLADPDSYGHGPVRGAVVIEAGLGGPDAVRQLLAGIPAGFARPVLVRLALDGGRYDRLVKQMSRATEAPVDVAEDGQVAQPGHVYFVPPGLGLRERGGWLFDATAPFDASQLPAHDSAVLFLSGADPALVSAVTGAGWQEGLVLGQTPDEGCYDPAGPQAAIAAGAGHDAPAGMAARLLERWPPPDAATAPDSSGLLQP